MDSDNRHNYKTHRHSTKRSIMTFGRTKLKCEFLLPIDLPERKQAHALALLLTGKYRETAMKVPKDELNADDGINKLIAELDKSFEKFVMTLPDPVRALKLIKGASLPAGERRLILSNCAKLEYDVVKPALKRTFAETMAPSDDRIVVKEETHFQPFQLEVKEISTRKPGNSIERTFWVKMVI